MAGGPERTNRTPLHSIHPMFNRPTSQQSRASSQQSRASSQQSPTSQQDEMVPETSTSTRSKNSTTRSWIWTHGEMERVGKERRWKCNYCPTNLSAGTTSNAMTHLKIHGLED